MLQDCSCKLASAGLLNTYGDIIIALTSASSRRRRRSGISHHDVTSIAVGPVDAESSQHRYRPSRATALEPLHSSRDRGPDQATFCMAGRIQSLSPFSRNVPDMRAWIRRD